ncbi:FKBP-type peptidyl-prolyl cis-trans isomerase [Psychromonas arctica]
MFKFILIIAIVIVAFFVFQSMGSSKAAPENIKKGQGFLAENATKEGVISTDSGLQYLILEKGEGTEHPTAKSKVKVHYHGTLIDGTVFDSSVDRGEPISFGLNQVIPGWTEGVQLMVEGDKFRFFIPSRLAYGNRSAGKIPAGSLLIFDVELLKINP